MATSNYALIYYSAKPSELKKEIKDKQLAPSVNSYSDFIINKLDLFEENIFQIDAQIIIVYYPASDINKFEIGIDIIIAAKTEIDFSVTHTDNPVFLTMLTQLYRMALIECTSLFAQEFNKEFPNSPMTKIPNPEIEQSTHAVLTALAKYYSVPE